MSASITVAGNLTRDFEHRVTDGGRSVASGRLAVNRRVPDGRGGWRDSDSTFLNVTRRKAIPTTLWQRAPLGGMRLARYSLPAK